MYSKESFDPNKSQYHHSHDCKSHFKARFGEAFAGGFHGAPWGRGIRRKMAAFKAVNIEESDEAFTLSLFAAGLKKEQFHLSVKDDILTISYQPAEEEDKTRWVHQEYRPIPFQRSFLLNGKVEASQISASYTDGVLRVTLPKNPEAKKPAQEIKVA